MGPRRSAPSEPAVPADVTGAELDRSVRAELRSLSKANAEMVGRHLVMTARLLVEDPEQAYAHAMAAQRRAGRIAAVREAAGLAAYHAGLWSEALAELRAARRMSGSSHQLPLMADCERGLGRPERALELAASPEASQLSTAERVELAIVVSGARRDLGETGAAVLAVQLPQLRATATHAFTPRLRYAYADALFAAGRGQEADHWFALAAESDHDGVTDADERLAQLRGIRIVDLLDDDDDDDVDAGDAGDRDASDAQPDRRRQPADAGRGVRDQQAAPARGDAPVESAAAKPQQQPQAAPDGPPARPPLTSPFLAPPGD